jgi:galactoside O-acetyltransferase
MAFLDDAALQRLGLRALGRNVRISDRAALHNPELLEIGDHSRIDDFCVVSGRVVLGRHVHLAVFCNLAGGSAGIAMHDFSGLAYGCHVFTQSDDYSGRFMTNPTVPPELRQIEPRAVVIGRHCIVGTGSIVFPGADLGEGAAVGAASVVKRAVPPWTVVAGVPARAVAERRRDLLALEPRCAGDAPDAEHPP